MPLRTKKEFTVIRKCIALFGAAAITIAVLLVVFYVRTITQRQSISALEKEIENSETQEADLREQFSRRLDMRSLGAYAAQNGLVEAKKFRYLHVPIAVGHPKL